MYNLIKTNDITGLQMLCEAQYQMHTIAQITFDYQEGDKEVLNMPEDNRKTQVSILNPIILAVKYRSLNCLKYLITKYGLRPSLTQSEMIIIRHDQHEYPFKQWLLPILLKLRDIEALTFLVNQPSFTLSYYGLNSFISYALTKQSDNTYYWQTGARILLESNAARFTYRALLNHEDRVKIIEKSTL
jgi:hypothetical protein